MTSKQTTFANLAEKFGHCLLENTTREGGCFVPSGMERRHRLRKIARVMDRLARQPDSFTWHQRAARLHQEISAILGRRNQRPTSASLWAAS